MDRVRFPWPRRVVAVTPAVLALGTAHAESCLSDSVAPECLMQRSQAEFEQAAAELNRTYQKALKTMSRPRDEYVDYPILKAKFVEAQRQ